MAIEDKTLWGLYQRQKGTFEKHSIKSLITIHEDVLKKARTGYKALSELCNGSEEVMIMMLNTLFIFPEFKRLEKKNNLQQRRYQKNRNRDFWRYIDQLTKEGIKHIDNVCSMSPEINKDRLIEILKAWITGMSYLFMRGKDKFNRSIDFVSMIDPETDYSSLRQALNGVRLGDPPDDEVNKTEHFNHWLISTYQICKKISNLKDNAIYENLSIILNTLNIETKQGSKFSRQNVYKIIKKSLSSPEK